MTRRRAWFDRRFELGLPREALRELVERLRGTPLRLAERTSGLSRAVLTGRSEGGWSIQEHAGHLADLEGLWLGRLDDLCRRLPTLREADLENRATWEAKHNERTLAEVLQDFGARRGWLLARLAEMSEDDLTTSASHPRLGQPMTATDLCLFVAEHDDHHLAAITELRAAAGV